MSDIVPLSTKTTLLKGEIEKVIGTIRNVIILVVGGEKGSY